MERITIDVVSDVVCPWCYLGKARLELAIAEVQDEVGVDINWRPYRLNPDYPPEGVDQKEALEQKLGGAERVAQAHKMLTDFGREVGINFDFEAIKIGPNTLDAHRLIHWAMVEDREKQDRVVNALFKANFEAMSETTPYCSTSPSKSGSTVQSSPPCLLRMPTVTW